LVRPLIESRKRTRISIADSSRPSRRLPLRLQLCGRYGVSATWSSELTVRSGSPCTKVVSARG
jgi:hypothetical protein